MTLTEPSTRTTRAFCVGQAKSGTASLCDLLSGNYRAAHVPERAELPDMILQESRDQVGQVAFPSYLAEPAPRRGRLGHSCGSIAMDQCDDLRAAGLYRVGDLVRFKDTAPLGFNSHDITTRAPGDLGQQVTEAPKDRHQHFVSG